LERPARSVRSPRRDKKTPVPTERDAAAKRSSSVDSATLISALVVLTLAVAVVRFSFYNPDFGALCRIARALDREDWEEIVRLEAPLAEPSNSVIDARILALSRLGRLGDELYLRPLVPARSPQLVQTASFGMCGDRILYEFGAVNPALRAATNNYVTKRERSAWAAFTLALCNVAEDRRAVAERYLYRLQGTLFHRARAAETAAYLNARSAETSTFTPYLRLAPLSDERRAELDASFAAVRAQKPTVDGFFPNRCVSHSRYYLVQTDDLAKRPLRERETRLATLLLMRDLPTFAEHLDGYLLEKTALKEASERRIPRFIQEAILLRGRFPQAFGRPADERWSVPVELEIDPEIARRFLDYLKTIDASRPQNDIFRDVDLYFRQTFWAEAFSISEVENY
ncbi:MAG: hypothetical protein IKU86_13505, partial [Thermoguttaceae bacterium]|nr:hypothetical protein [Thermoguttaceae bacterium]